MKNWIYPTLQKRWKAFFVVALVLTVTFAIIAPVVAGPADIRDEDAGGSAIAGTLNWVISGILKVAGRILIALVQLLIWISKYNDFINAQAVVNGWVIVRDIANMFFIVILLIIAFGTILGQEQYQYKKLLPKLLIMAVVINFSRTIVGVFIDFAQVIMLTFVNGYAAAAGGNFANLFQVTDLLQLDPDKCSNVTGSGYPAPGNWEVFGAMLLALIMVVVSIVTVVIIFAVLALRVIVLWLLTILSPLAFLMGTFPQGQKYYGQWWEEFKNQVLVGPMLAFFLWLSLTTVGGGNASAQITAGGAALVNTGEEVVVACSGVGSADKMMSFAIGTMMLIVGVQMAQSMGSAISGIAGKAKSFATRTVPKIAGGVLGLGYKAAKPVAGYGAELLSAGLGVELRPAKWKEAFKNMRETSKLRRESTMAAKAQARLHSGSRWKRFWAAGGAPQDFLENPTDFVKAVAGPKESADQAAQRMGQAVGFRKQQKDYQLLARGPAAYKDLVTQDAKMAGSSADNYEQNLENHRREQWKQQGATQDKDVKRLEQNARKEEAGLTTSLATLSGDQRQDADQYIRDWKTSRDQTDQNVVELEEEDTELQNREAKIQLDYDINVRPLEQSRQRYEELNAKPADQLDEQEQQELAGLKSQLPQIEKAITAAAAKHQRQYGAEKTSIAERRKTISAEKRDNMDKRVTAADLLDQQLRARNPNVANAALKVRDARADAADARQAQARIKVNAKMGGAAVGTAEEDKILRTIQGFRNSEREAQRIANMSPAEMAKEWEKDRSARASRRLNLEVAAASGGGVLDDKTWESIKQAMESAGLRTEAAQLSKLDIKHRIAEARKILASSARR